jgi:hypothetical protein
MSLASPLIRRSSLVLDIVQIVIGGVTIAALIASLVVRLANAHHGHQKNSAKIECDAANDN